MKKWLLIFVVWAACVGTTFAAADPNIPPVPVATGLMPLIPPSATIPNVDILHTPKFRDNLFNVDLASLLGGEGTEVTARNTFKTAHKWYGQDLFDKKGAYSWGVNYKFPKIASDTLGGNFYFDVERWYALSNPTSDEQNAEQIDYRVYYVKTFFADEFHETQVTISETYYDLKEAEMGEDGQEFGVGLAFTNLMKEIFPSKVLKVIPSMYVGNVWDLELDASGSKLVNRYDGTVANMGVDVYYQASNMYVFDFYGKVNYMDAAELANGDEIPGTFTDFTAGVACDWKVSKGFIITPFVNYTYYIDESLLNEGADEGQIWGGISMRYMF